jgi:hypothetical protein
MVGAVFAVGNLEGRSMSVLQETTDGRMEIGSTPKGKVGDMYLYSFET